jgi:hypothetical protein
VLHVPVIAVMLMTRTVDCWDGKEEPEIFHGTPIDHIESLASVFPSFTRSIHYRTHFDISHQVQRCYQSHQYVEQNNSPIADIIVCTEDYAFVASPYPVILSIGIY